MSRSAFLSQTAPDCPPSLIAQAATGPAPRVAIARAGAELPMMAAKDATEAGIMTPIFVGEEDAIKAEADTLNWDISGYAIHNTNGEADAANTAAALCGSDEADVLMKGHLHTDMFMKGVLTRDNGLRTASRLVHVFHITPPGRDEPLLVSDAAVNVTPDIKTRQACTQAVVDLARARGIERPKVAFLSATESAIPSVPSSIEAQELCDWATAEIDGADFSGPLAMDLILSPEAVATKGLTDNPVAGRADCIVVPDIVSGNAIFKSLVYMGGGCAGGVVMGAKVPVLLTSRADPPAARMASAALAAILTRK
ncbi:bifunctional enoyl-CoA hydratase/phosphate acetyltransferase [Amylibacter sp. IMCC11727]|uniref:bifunctional enoyl-CoA hydratase/phosphate acetyltransferase n=1 Tax=Amylibacter sp. IMCC11727 TaxID=3039851 RepID=UPI00244E2D28|nr:bifunctional enoyl-CoA hydratase/phosphate acetyltransferase [Amylibacter sp. IMCC11727]WGI20994.1 bifunctional enoyl-CoA hydratase/phosphate acetyltransferase [Amylibacter sp. IMCC11727]